MKRIQDLVARAGRFVDSYAPLRVTRDAIGGMTERDGMHYAAGMAYYTLLALFQLAVLAVVVLSFFFGTGGARVTVVEQMSSFLPLEAETAEDVVDAVLESRGGVSALAVPFLIFGSLGAFAALRRGVNRIFDVPEPRALLWQQLGNVLLIAALGTVFIVSLVVRFAASVLQRFMERLPIPGTPLLAELVGLLVPFLLAFSAFLLIYRLVPNRRVTMRAVWLGAFVAAIFWTALQAGFSFYATHIASYDTAFGPISSSISLLVFLFFSSVITLAGASLAHALLVESERS